MIDRVNPMNPRLLLIVAVLALGEPNTAGAEAPRTERCQVKGFSYQMLVQMGFIYKGELVTDTVLFLIVSEQHWNKLPFHNKVVVASNAACQFAKSEVPLDSVLIISDLTNQPLGNWYRGQLTLSTPANSVECQAELPAARTGNWSWRNIDGKRCWYAGRPGRDKASLQWPRSAPQPAWEDGDSSQPKQDRARPK
jgi:hypothetical protein